MSLLQRQDELVLLEIQRTVRNVSCDGETDRGRRQVGTAETTKLTGRDWWGNQAPKVTEKRAKGRDTVRAGIVRLFSSPHVVRSLTAVLSLFFFIFGGEITAVLSRKEKEGK
jgi:hypothetical protein